MPPVRFFARSTFARCLLVIGLSLSSFASSSARVQAQVLADQLTPTETSEFTPAPIIAETEPPILEPTDDAETGEVFAIPDHNPDEDELEATQLALGPFLAQSAEEESSLTTPSAPTPIADDPAIQQFPNIAYNSTDDNYLVAWSEEGTPHSVRGRLLSAIGNMQGEAFTIAAGSTGLGQPGEIRMAYNASDNTYIILWSEPNGLISIESYCSGNCITYSLPRYNLYFIRVTADGTPLTAAPTLVTTQLIYTNFTAGFYDVAFNETQNEYLLAWMQPRGAIISAIAHPARLVVQRFGSDGAPRSPIIPLVIGTASSLSLTYNPLSQDYLVTSDTFSAATGYNIRAQRFDANTLFAKGGAFSLVTAPGWQYYAAVARDPSHDRYLVTWNDERNAAARHIRGRLVSGAGTLLTGDIVVPSTAENIYGLWHDVAYSPVEQRYLVLAASGQTDPPLMGQEISSEGQLVGEPVVFPAGAHFVSLAAHTNPQTEGRSTWQVAWQWIHDIYGQGWPEVTPSQSVSISVTDSAGNPVSALALNSDGWPVLNAADGMTVANPVTVAVKVDDDGFLGTKELRFSVGIRDAGWERFRVTSAAPGPYRCETVAGAIGEVSSEYYMASCRIPAGPTQHFYGRFGSSHPNRFIFPSGFTMIAMPSSKFSMFLP